MDLERLIKEYNNDIKYPDPKQCNSCYANFIYLSLNSAYRLGIWFTGGCKFQLPSSYDNYI